FGCYFALLSGTKSGTKLVSPLPKNGSKPGVFLIPERTGRWIRTLGPPSTVSSVQRKSAKKSPACDGAEEVICCQGEHGSKGAKRYLIGVSAPSASDGFGRVRPLEQLANPTGWWLRWSAGGLEASTITAAAAPARQATARRRRVVSSASRSTSSVAF